jgi:hypothetical protein
MKMMIKDMQSTKKEYTEKEIMNVSVSNNFKNVSCILTQQVVCSLLKRLIHVKAYMHIISFRWALVLVLAENCISHHDFLKTISSSLHPCASGSKGLERASICYPSYAFLWPCDISRFQKYVCIL